MKNDNLVALVTILCYDFHRQDLGKSKKRTRREEQKSKKENKNQLIPVLISMA
jgi:hypothetical protein